MNEEHEREVPIVEWILIAALMIALVYTVKVKTEIEMQLEYQCIKA